MPFCKHKKKSRCKNVCQDCKYTVPIIEIPQSSQEISHFRVIKETVFLCLKAKFQDLQNPQSLFLLHQRSLKCSIRLIFMWHKAGRGTAIWIQRTIRRGQNSKNFNIQLQIPYKSTMAVAIPENILHRSANSGELYVMFMYTPTWSCPR